MLRITPDNLFRNNMAPGSTNTEYKLTKLDFYGLSYTFPIYFLYKTLWPCGGTKHRDAPYIYNRLLNYKLAVIIHWQYLVLPSCVVILEHHVCSFLHI